MPAGDGLLRQLGRFALVGVSNTLVSLVVYAALRGASAPAAAAAAFAAGALNGYWWNGRWTFTGNGRRRSLVRYAVVQSLAAGTAAALVSVGIPFVAVLALVTVASFTANRAWAFARVAGTIGADGLPRSSPAR